MSFSVEYQKYLSNKLLHNSNNKYKYYLLCVSPKNNFAVPMTMLRSLVVWQKPKPVYPMPKYILGFLLIGQITTTVVSIESMVNLPFYQNSISSLQYKCILCLNSDHDIAIALQACQISTISNLNNTIILDGPWLKNNLFDKL